MRLGKTQLGGPAVTALAENHTNAFLILRLRDDSPCFSQRQRRAHKRPLPLHPLQQAFVHQHAESLPETERPRAYALAAAGWQGSAAGNVCFVASVLSGGSFIPACIVVGVAWGWNTWNASEPERRDAERCAAMRERAHKPKLRCPFMKTHIERPAPAPGLITAQGLVAP